jgi:hypothetical protein
VVIALAAPARSEIIFQRNRAPHSLHGRFDRSFRQDGPAEIGMEYGAGKIEDRPDVRRIVLLGELKGSRSNRARARAGQGAFLQRRVAEEDQRLSDGSNSAFVTEARRN